MAIKLEMLRTFVAVAHAGELAQASRALGRTPSAVSMTLKQVQDELGTALFETDRKASLTKAGEVILAEAERALHNFDHSLSTIKNHAKADIGFIRIAAVPSAASTILPIAIKALLETKPGLHIDLRDMDSSAVVVELLQGRIDVGIATSGNERHGISAELLWEDQFELVMSLDHPLASQRDLTLGDISNEVFISNGLCVSIKLPEVQKMIACSSLSIRNTTSLMSMIKQGLGITILPSLVAKQAADGVVFVALKDMKSTRRLDILTSTDGPQSPAVQLLLKELRKAAISLIDAEPV